MDNYSKPLPEIKILKIKTMTVREFAKKLLSYKEELLDKEVVILAPNGELLKATTKLLMKERFNLDLTKENVESVIVTID